MIPLNAQIEMFPELTEQQQQDIFKFAHEVGQVADRLELPRDNPLDVQVAGSHYKDMNIQPVEYIHANSIGYFEGNVIKYISRWRKKNGIADLEKAKHYIDLLIEMETRYGADTRIKG